MKQDNCRYCICDVTELNCGGGVEIKTPNGWIMMWVGHDGTDYYLDAFEFSFYPKKVRARSR